MAKRKPTELPCVGRTRETILSWCFSARPCALQSGNGALAIRGKTKTDRIALRRAGRRRQFCPGVSAHVRVRYNRAGGVVSAQRGCAFSRRSLFLARVFRGLVTRGRPLRFRLPFRHRSIPSPEDNFKPKSAIHKDATDRKDGLG